MSEPEGLFYEDDLLTLYCANNNRVLPHLSDVDLIVTSPPYNLGGEPPWPYLGHWKPGDVSGSGGQSKWRKGANSGNGVNYDVHEDNMGHDQYVKWQRDTIDLCWRTLSDTGAIFYNHKPRVIGTQLWTPLELNPRLPLRQIIIWKRSGGVNYLPTAYVPMHEWIMVIAKHGFRLRDRSASGAGDVWDIPQQPNVDHPAPFPVEIPARAIETTAPKLVVDPFAGSGSTLVAARQAGVRCIGIEKSETYCEKIVRRLQGVTPVDQQVDGQLF